MNLIFRALRQVNLWFLLFYVIMCGLAIMSHAEPSVPIIDIVISVAGFFGLLLSLVCIEVWDIRKEEAEKARKYIASLRDEELLDYPNGENLHSRAIQEVLGSIR